MTFMGPEEYPVSFTLIRAKDADPYLTEYAGRAICQFIINENFLKDEDSDMMDDDD